MTKTATVLGAGIQGVCVALMLQKHGYRVRLIDKSQDIINRASLNYEGRIHLGFIYGMDKSLLTGYKMIRDALHFAPYMDYLLEEHQNWFLSKSKPTIYLVAYDSMLLPKEVEAYYEKLDAFFQDQISNKELHYLGERPPLIFRKVASPEYVNPGMVNTSFLTEEASVDQVFLKDQLKQRISASPSIELFLDHYVTEITAKPIGFQVECRKKDESKKSFRSDLVFNCLWESRPYFDKLMGVKDELPHSIRIKYGLVMKANDILRRMNSINIIQGSYGALVIGPRQDRAFCSWYPASMKGLIKYGPIPEAWDQACEGIISDALIEELREESLKGFRKFIPELSPFDILEVRAGLILAEGMKDITNPDSLFHSRNETPIYEKAGYYSISTSKYTSAPRNTMLLEQMLFG